MSERGLRFQTYIDDVLVHEAWSSDVHPEEIAERSGNLIIEATEAGREFRIEVYDPDLPPAFATMRIGSTPAGMTHPRRTESLEELEAMMMADYTGRLALNQVLEGSRKPKDDA